MVVVAFLSGPPLNPQISSIHLYFASFGLVFGPDPLWVMPACTCAVSWAVGNTLGPVTPSLCRP